MKRLRSLLLLIPFTFACTCSTLTPTTTLPPLFRATATLTPPPAPADTATPTARVATNTPTRNTTPTTATSSNALTLNKINPLPKDCSDSPFGLPAQNIIEVAYLPTGFCFNGEIDLFEKNNKLYAALSLSDEAALFIADVTDPSKPVAVGAWQLSQFTYTADLKTFKQQGKNYLLLSHQLLRGASDLCGITIIEVDDPTNPKLIGHYNGKNTDNVSNWCEVHTTQISVDATGDGAFAYLSSLARGDLRVIDIRDFKNVREINHYTFELGTNRRNFVHDSTIVGDRVYVGYWSGGLMVLDRKQVEAGQTVKPLNPAGSIAPSGFQVHQAYPTADGKFVFIEDEVNYKPPFSQLRLYDIRDLQNPKEVLTITLDKPFSSPHNLLVEGNLLYVGWYMDGVRVFKYDVSNPAQPKVEPLAFKCIRAEKGTGVFGSDIYDGVWGVRLHECPVKGESLNAFMAVTSPVG